MSCVTFLTDDQRRRLRRAALEAAPVSTFRSPEVTGSSVRRVLALAQDPRPGIRASAAAHRLLPEPVAGQLVSDEDLQVRVALARNPWSTPTTLERLADDTSATVRAWVAANPSCPAATTTRLAEDAEPHVRRMVAWARQW